MRNEVELKENFMCSATSSYHLYAEKYKSMAAAVKGTHTA